MSAHELTVAARMEAGAIIERITGENDMAQADVERLVELVPAHKQTSWFQMRGRWSLPGSSMSGHAAGIGDVSVEDEQRKGGVDLGVAPILRVGGYKVEHTVGEMVIRHFFAADVPLEDQQDCLLEYHVRPARLMMLRVRLWKLGPVEFAWPRWQLWKTARTERLE